MDWLKIPLDWFQDHPTLGWWLMAIAIALNVIVVVMLPIMIAKLPEDYFVRALPRLRDQMQNRFFALHLLAVIAKNLFGVFLFLMGIVMLITPGPGIIAMLLAITMIDFPGKRALQLRTVRLGIVHKILDAIRTKAGQPRFILPGRSIN